MPRTLALALLWLAGGCSVLFEPTSSGADGGGAEEADGAVALECPDDYVAALGSCYWASRGELTAPLAGLRCREDGEEPSAHLVVIDDAAENEHVYSLFNGEQTWIGLARPNEVWVWVTGEELQGANAAWSEGEPSTNSDRCVVIGDDMEGDMLYERVWDNKPCTTEQHAFVCEYDGKPPAFSIP